jgi:uncharacterized protein (DUF362 family)
MSKVIIKECTTYNINNVIEKINCGIEFLGGWSKFVHPGMKILLKVNLIGPKVSDSAAVTHCEFVRAIIRILRSKGCTIWIGDSSGGAIAGIAPTAKSFLVSGLEKVAEEENAMIKNFDREGVIEVRRNSNPAEKMYIAKPMFDADLVINLPKFKTHTAGIYTGAVKNLFGCIPGLKKAEYHKNAPNPLEFGEVIADINKAVKVGLHIMDGIVAMQGEGPTSGEVYNGGKILISTDPLALDTVASKMIGIDIKQIPILNASIKRGIGEHDINSIKLYGDYDEIPVLKDFKLPKNFGIKKKKANSKALSSVIKLLKSRPSINIKKCKKCNMCVESCPVEAINRESKRIDYSKCIECLCCHELCLHKAVELKRDNPLVGILLKFYRGAYK